MSGLRAFLRIRLKSDEQVSVVELLKRTPLDHLEQTVAALTKRHPNEEIRKAMVELIACAPLTEFETLKTIYLKHCGGAKQ